MTDPVQGGAATRQVRCLLAHILRRVTFPGHDELLQQVPNIEVVGGPITMLDLRVNPPAPTSPCPDGPVPGWAFVTESGRRETGEILIWVTAGYIDCMEYAWYTDDPPTHLPSVDQVDIRHSI
ncbi:MAG TPA: hypothetical protein VMU51_28520 [Mycobacteriales bacterium]|nr:hypothetical protein [Mycobacteriales bacterium]